MERAKAIGQFAVAFGLVYLASAILYLTVEVSTIRRQAPAVMASLDDMEAGRGSHPLLTRIDRTLDTLPLVTTEMAGIRELVPEVLSEVGTTREVLPQLLAESAAIRAALPEMYKELEKTRIELAALRAETPVMIEAARVLVEETRSASQGIADQAAQGAVQGTVKGIINAPLDVLKQGADLVTPRNEEEE